MRKILTTAAATVAVFAAGFAAATATTVAAAPTAAPGHLAPCFGHQGVQYATKDAYVCQVKLGDDPSGSLYFMVTLDEGLNHAFPGRQVFWYKLHPADGNYYVMETFTPGCSPRSSCREVEIDVSPTSQCNVILPSWSGTPAECTDETHGGAPGATHPLTAAEASSMAEFMRVMAAEVPGEYR